MVDPIICGKIMKVMILPNYYDTAINLSQEHRCHKLDRACYHVVFLIDSKLIYILNMIYLTYSLVPVRVLEEAEEDNGFNAII